MSRTKIPVLIVLSFMLCAFTFPWEAQPQKKEAETAPQPKQSQKIKDLAQTTEEDKTQFATEVETVKKLNAGAVNQAPFQPVRLSRAPKIEKLPAARIQPIQPVRPIDTAPNIQKIQQQINDIIKIQETLKQTQQGQLSEVQRIIDQARIHQRILDDLKATKMNQERAGKAATEKLLEQEKVRLIGKETEQNQKRLEDLAKAPKAPAVKTSAVIENSQTGQKPVQKSKKP